MNPRVLLALWRARWSKSGGLHEVPYLYGKVNKWGTQMATSTLWSVPIIPGIAIIVALMLFWILCASELPLTNQMQFSVGILVVSLFIRRFSGLLVTLVLASLSLIMSSRYLIWRYADTLSTELTIDFLFGFCLCSMELLVCLTVAVGVLRALWPQYRSTAPLITAPERWPRVDIFLLLGGRSPAEVELMVDQAAAIDWPKKRRLLYLLDDRERIELRDFAAMRGARYLVNTAAIQDKAAEVNYALQFSHGEFIAVFDGQDPIEHTILRATLGWFVRDLRLGMLLSPFHFTAPKPTPLSLAQFNVDELSGSFAMFRRSMLTYVTGLTTENKPEDVAAPHTALKLRAAGFRSAYVGVQRLEISDQRALSRQPLPSDSLRSAASSPLIRVDDPFSERTLTYKQRLADLAAGLDFYAVVPRTVFLIAPLLFLLGGFNLIQTSPALFAAYALPHFFQGFIVRARLRGQTRYSVEVDLREGLLSLYLMLRTTLRLVRPGISSLQKMRSFTTPRNDEPIAWASMIWFGAVMLLNLIAVTVGVVDSLTANIVQIDVTAMYVIWCGWNVMQLAAMLAVGEEARSIRQHHRQIKSMPAMLKLASGRTVSCTTQNFPQETLELALRSPMNIDVDQSVMVSIFAGQREYAFAAHTTMVHESRLVVTIDVDARTAFTALGTTSLSQSLNRPQWLPGPHADRLLPIWLSKAIINSAIAVLDFFTHPGQHLRRLRVRRLAFSWKQKK